jgi:uncharacterized protein with PQ loop repeat
VTTLRATAGSVGGAAGVLGVAIPMVGVMVMPIWRFPPTTATAGQITAFVTGHRAALQAMMVLYTVGVTLWLVFGACVWTRVRMVAGVESALPTCFAAGLAGFVSLLLAGFTTFDILVYRGGPPVETRLLYDLTFGMLAMSGFPTAVSMAAFAVAGYRHRVLPRYTAHLATAGAGGHVLLLLSFIVAAGFFSLEGAVIVVVPALLWAWILATGVALLRAHA